MRSQSSGMPRFIPRLCDGAVKPTQAVHVLCVYERGDGVARRGCGLLFWIVSLAILHPCLQTHGPPGGNETSAVNARVNLSGHRKQLRLNERSHGRSRDQKDCQVCIHPTPPRESAPGQNLPLLTFERFCDSSPARLHFGYSAAGGKAAVPRNRAGVWNRPGAV